MVQRIQTIFLILTACLSILMIFTPVAELKLDNGEIIKLLSIDQSQGKMAISLINGVIPIVVILSFSIIISLASIFIYKDRIVQMRMCMINSLLMLIVFGLLIFNFIVIQKKYALTFPHFYVALTIPFINILLLILAYRYIRKDELLVKSYDRLR